MIKYREILVYLIVGVLTTIVSWVVCFLLKLPLDPTVTWQNFVINTGGWLDIVIMEVTVNVLHMDYWIAKIFISAVLVTIINYVLRKVLIFNKKK